MPWSMGLTDSVSSSRRKTTSRVLVRATRSPCAGRKKILLCPPGGCAWPRTAAVTKPEHHFGHERDPRVARRLHWVTAPAAAPLVHRLNFLSHSGGANPLCPPEGSPWDNCEASMFLKPLCLRLSHSKFRRWRWKAALTGQTRCRPELTSRATVPPRSRNTRVIQWSGLEGNANRQKFRRVRMSAFGKGAVTFVLGLAPPRRSPAAAAQLTESRILGERSPTPARRCCPASP